MDKKPKKHGPDNSDDAPDKAKRVLSGIAERLAEQADRELKVNVETELATIRTRVYRTMPNTQRAQDFMHQLTHYVYVNLEAGNRELAYNKFLHEHDELRAWADARKKEMAEQQSSEVEGNE